MVSGLAALAGFLLGDVLSPLLLAGCSALAAGAILAMLVDTMIPEAYDGTHELAGVITVVGFLVAFLLGKTIG